MAKSNIKETEAIKSLSKRDVDGGVNATVEEVVVAEEVGTETKKKKTSLGKAKTSPGATSMAGESPWKLVGLENLPSEGLSYHENMEILIRSAKTKEIRHWSTIDEHDPLDVSEKIGFILNSCSKLNIKGDSTPLNSNDLLEIDKYQLLFKIHRITFPNDENKLLAKINCIKCKHVNSIHVSDINLKGFSYPKDVMEWYSAEERCFVVKSEKLNDTFKLYLPTIGSTSILGEYADLCQSRGLEKDEAFDKIVPYLIGDWRNVSAEDIVKLKNESNRWHENKFLFLHKATNMLDKNSKNRVLGVCEKCKAKINSSIFLGGSFTVKDIFIISTGLRDLV
jgi:hypothetical protein